MDDLVSTDWLAANLGAADLVLLDATKYLPTEGFDGHAEYLKAHLPGARFLDIDAFADQETELPHMAPTAGRFARLAAALGIGNATRVVLYDQKGINSAPRGWWLFRLFGHEHVAVLDGGLPRWRAAGFPLETGAPPPPTAATYLPRLTGTRLAGLGDVQRALADASALVLDARAAGRFNGTAPEPRPGLPSGHMPGARNLPFTELLAADGTLLPPAALAARFAAAGVDGSRPVITSCGTGVTACVLALGLRRAGLPDAAVYDGSWTEWANRPDTPKAKA
jgi:thiosulfate/3-mercaptopyruvate sulfurtransferase